MIMFSRAIYAPALLVLSLCAACSKSAESDVEEEEGSGKEASALTSTNGIQLNGIQLNGIQLNGIQLNGIQLNGIQLNGIQLNGIQLNGTTLSGTLVGAAVSGEALIDATMTGALSNGGTVTLRVDAVTSTLDPEIKRYTISYFSDSTWKDLCGSTDAGPTQAIPLKGRWDSTGTYVSDASMFTFACRGAALAKCVEIGYKPWKSVQECKSGTCKSVSLAPVHQACTRMVRADYCGDGVPHTTDGTPVNVWDALGVQTEAPVSNDWKLEAEWSSSGALCVKNLRHNVGSVTSQYINNHCPSRWSAPGFNCFDTNSTFFTKHGFSTPLASRSLLRNSFDYAFVNNGNNDDN
jgi:hypothetical protein